MNGATGCNFLIAIRPINRQLSALCWAAIGFLGLRIAVNESLRGL